MKAQSKNQIICDYKENEFLSLDQDEMKSVNGGSGKIIFYYDKYGRIQVDIILN
jgi:hypothetical protein